MDSSPSPSKTNASKPIKTPPPSKRSCDDPNTRMTHPRPNLALQPREPRRLLTAGTLLLDPIPLPGAIAQARIAVAGDFNNDNKLDLAVVSGGFSDIRIRGV